MILRPPPDAIPSGFCECGCGEKTPIAKQARPKYGQYKGHPMRYIKGHNARGKRAATWKGGRHRTAAGYWLVWNPGHHLANSAGYVPEHRLAWEEANDRRLTKSEDVHHIDGDRGNNDPNNLVALTKQEHTRLHVESADTRRKLSDASKRRYQDPEQRAHSSATTRRAWADGRMANRKKPERH